MKSEPIQIERHALQALITRPREDSESLAAALAARSVKALLEPLMQIHYCIAAALDLSGVQAVLCTSANGVRALAQASIGRNVPLLAVGDATAACARAEGFSAVESAGGDVGKLAHLAAARLRPEGGQLVHVAGSVAAGDLSKALRAKGFTVEKRVLYEARPAAALSPMAINALQAGAIDLALFFSPRTSAIFAKLAAAAAVAERCARVTALSISPATDAPLADVPWLDRRVADRPNQAALLEALDRVLSERARS